MGIKNKQTAIVEADVPRLCDHARIARLARVGKLPAGADIARFGAGVRGAARFYASVARAAVQLGRKN